MKEPRLCVGIVLVNEEGNVFVGKRHFKDKTQEDVHWQMPQGGIDPGETPCDAMLRELYEETGINEDNIEVIAESKNWYTYEIPTEYQKRHFVAQQQKWFLVKFSGSEQVINLKHKHQEFSEWKWTNPKQISKLVIPFKKEVYKQVMKDFEWYF